MNTPQRVNLLGLTFERLYSREFLHDAVERLAKQIAAGFEKKTRAVGTMYP